MKLSINSFGTKVFHALYNFAFLHPKDKLCYNLCDLFWGALFGILHVVLSPIEFLVTRFTKNQIVHKDWENPNNFSTGMAALSIRFFVTFFLISPLLLSSDNKFMLWKIVALVIGIVIALGTGIYGIILYNERKNKTNFFKPINDFGRIISTGISSTKEKYCPIITYDEKPDKNE